MNAGEEMDVNTQKLDFQVEDYTWFYSNCGLSFRASKGGFSVRTAEGIGLLAYLSDMDDQDSCKTGLVLLKDEVRLAYYEGTKGDCSMISLAKDAATLKGTMMDTEVVLYSKNQNISIVTDGGNLEAKAFKDVKMEAGLDMKLQCATDMVIKSDTITNVEGQMTQIKGSPLKLN